MTRITWRRRISVLCVCECVCCVYVCVCVCVPCLGAFFIVHSWLLNFEIVIVKTTNMESYNVIHFASIIDIYSSRQQGRFLVLNKS